MVAVRLKQSGMMWGLPVATGMLQLRASIKSRRLNSDHERLLPELSHPHRRLNRWLPDRSL